MDTKAAGYAQKDFGQPVKRYCQTLWINFFCDTHKIVSNHISCVVISTI